jgi:hypothetical protein
MGTYNGNNMRGKPPGFALFGTWLKYYIHNPKYKYKLLNLTLMDSNIDKVAHIKVKIFI